MMEPCIMQSFLCYCIISSKNALGTYAVTIVTKPSTTTPTLCWPCQRATIPITPLKAPSTTRTNCPFSNYGTSVNDTMVLSISAAQIIFRLSI